FFSYFFERFLGQNLTCRKAGAVVSLRLARARRREKLIVRKIIRPKLRRRSEYLVALDGNPTMSTRNELIFVRVGRDDPSAARGQTINQPAVGCNAKHSDAHRALSRRRCRSNAFVFAARTRLSGSRRLRSVGAFRRCRSNLALT